MRSLQDVGCVATVCVCVIQAACLAQEPEQAVRPMGTFIRPRDGVHDAALDDAWNEYRASIGTAANAFRAVIDAKLLAARDKGDLNATQAIQVWRLRFENEGILPGGTPMQEDAKKAGFAFRDANKELLEAYDAVIANMTKEGKVADATAVKDERGGLVAGLAFPPMANVPESLFDERDWSKWGPGWGGGKHQVLVKGEVRLTDSRFFHYQTVMAGDTTFELEVRNRVWEKPGSVLQCGWGTKAGGCVVRIPARAPDGAVLPGKGEVVHFNHVPAVNNVLLRNQFACRPPVVTKWYAIRLSRTGGRYSVVVNDHVVVDNLQLPAEVQPDYMLTIGVLDGAADFRDLRVTQDVSR